MASLGRIDNREYAREIVRLLVRSGVEEAVCGAGNRNAPLLEALFSQSRIKVYSHFSENAGAFFALGRTKLHGKRVAVVTTSGTAACELLPAVCEAYYSGAPLVLVTADLPERFRGTGAPQGIFQERLFGPHVLRNFDVTSPEKLPLPEEMLARGPVHLNVCFEDTAIAGEAKRWDPGQNRVEERVGESCGEEGSDAARAREIISSAKRPLVLLGPLRETWQRAVVEFLRELSSPVYAEALSGLRGRRDLEEFLLRGGSSSLARHKPDLLIRLGGVPTASYWRNLERVPAERRLPVISFSSEPFTGLARESSLFSLSSLANFHCESAPAAYLKEVRERDAELSSELEKLFTEFPQSEPSLVRGLSLEIEHEALVYLGNSMPVRTWDLAAAYQADRRAYAGNRGANGIDGQLSTFLGMCEARRTNWCVLGDLTTLYDMSAPFILPQLDKASAIRVLVINNQGGRIFEELPSFELFKKGGTEARLIQEHSCSFRPFAEMWGFEYRKAEDAAAMSELPARALVELMPDRQQTACFYSSYRELIN